MAYVTPKTNYLDDVLNTDVNQLRKYNIVNNADGSISLIDVTNYSQVGTFVGAKELNEIGTDIIDLDDTKLDKTGDAANATVAFAIATTEANIVTGEKQSILFGKILKSISTFRTGKINTSQIINNLAATITGNVLDATQGKALNDKFTLLNTNLALIGTVYTTTKVAAAIAGGNWYSLLVNLTVPAGSYVIIASAYVDGGTLENLLRFTHNTNIAQTVDSHAGLTSYASLTCISTFTSETVLDLDGYSTAAQTFRSIEITAIRIK